MSAPLCCRIEPTPEDSEIFSRNIKRVIKWSLADDNARRRADLPVKPLKEFVAVSERATRDMIHFGPTP